MICCIVDFIELDVSEIIVCGWYVEGFVVWFDYWMVGYIGFFIIV